MAFNPLGFMFARLMTQGMTDQHRADEISLLGGLLGGNLAGVVLLASAAREEAPSATLPPPAGTSPPVSTQLEAPPFVQIPEVAEFDRDRAQAVLEGHGLVVVVESVETADGPVDSVIATSPPAASVVPRGSSVDLQVSAGLMIPDVTGKRAEEAEEQLRKVGFDVRSRSIETAGKEGFVESQEPVAGSLADRDTVVTIYVFEPRRRGPLRSADSEDD